MSECAQFVRERLQVSSFGELAAISAEDVCQLLLESGIDDNSAKTVTLFHRVAVATIGTSSFPAGSAVQGYKDDGSYITRDTRIEELAYFMLPVRDLPFVLPCPQV